MRIDRVEVSGWMPFAGRHAFDLPSGPIAVVARHRNNPRRSNWAGKTSLIEAVTWCLFGTHRKRIEDGIINRSASACEVVLHVGDLVVSRTRERGSSTVLKVSRGQESWRGNAAQGVIVQALGVALDDYEATVSFRQDDVESIVGMRAGKRREVISSWLRLERWSVAAKRAGDHLRRSQQRLAETQAAIRALDAVADVVTQDDVDTVRMRREGHRLEQQSVLSELRSMGDLDRLSADLKRLDDARVRVREMRSKLADRGGLSEALEVAQSGLAITREEFASSRKRRDELLAIVETGFDGKCPVMCEQCPVADTVDSHVSASARLLGDSEDAFAAAQLAHANRKQEVDALVLKVRALDRLAGDYAAEVNHGRELAQRVGSMTTAEVETLRHRQRALNLKCLEVSAALTEADRELGMVEARFRAAQQQSGELEKRQAELSGLEQDVCVWSLVTRAFGPAGIPATIARLQVTRLQASTNELLSGSGLSIEFAWERPTKDRAPVCVNCGFVYSGQRDKQCPSCTSERGAKMSDELEILVDDGSGEIEDVRMKSGGARVMVASALRLAAIAMLRDLRGASVGWATIDEPFGPLDSELRESLAGVFAGMLGAVGLEQAFVVSHDQTLLDRLPHRIVIERDESISTLRLEAS